MPIQLLHRGLANSASLFLAIIAIWALVQFLRSRPLGASWYGAAVVAELLLLVQFVLGGILWLEGMQAGPRPWIHILYGTVAIITLPAAHSYFSHLEDAKVQSLAMAFVCAFLWGIVQRSGQVITLPAP